MAQNYEIDIKRFNGQDYDTLLPTPAAHASTHQADGSDPITVKTGNIESGAVSTAKIANSAVSTAKIADKAVTRSKLANDALYSPLVNVSTDAFNFDVSHLGKTLVCNKSTSDFVITITEAQSELFPNSGEVAVLWQTAKSVKIACGENVYFGVAGKSGFQNLTVALPEQFSMCALKKIYHANGKAFWVLTGNVEVV